MTSSHAAQLIGTVGLGIFGLLLLHLSTSVRRFGLYGREALACAGAFLLSTVVARMLALLGTITHEQAREINGLIAVVYLVILLQLIILRHKAMKLHCER